jgi:TrmH family RNA methyltransferase
MSSITLEPPSALSEATAAIETHRNPAVTRVADVLRSRSSKPRTILIDDEENIAQAVHAGVHILTIYTSADRVETGVRPCREASVREHVVLGGQVLRSLFAGEKHSRVFALGRAPKQASWADLAARQGDLLVLDGVRIAGNIGAIIRSACAFNIAGIVLLNSDMRSIYDRRLLRASRGLLFMIPTLTATHAELESFLASERISLASITADATTPLSGISRVSGRLAILMGSERSGASTALDSAAARRFAVPMMPGVESLNVSVAAGLALYERRRGKVCNSDSQTNFL